MAIEMARPPLVLAAMAAGGRAARFDATRLQSLLFVIGREVAEDIGGPHFEFGPGPCGPHDPAVFETADRLVGEGRAGLDRALPCWAYFATGAGYREGRAELERMPPPAARLVVAAADWMLQRSFREILAAIFERYPEMAVDAGIPLEGPRGRGGPLERHPFLRGMAQSVGALGRRRERTEAPAALIAADWWTVGDELRDAMERVLPATGR